MLIVFRADASTEIGSGHVMRCLTLADALSQDGHQCQFVCREQEGHLGELIVSRGYSMSLLPSSTESVSCQASDDVTDYAGWLGVSWQEDANQTLDCFSLSKPDLLVIDNYALDFEWENRLSSAVKKIFVIDDLANRPHRCDFLLDQNLGRTTHDYDGLVPAGCTKLIGPRFAMLRPEFVKFRERSLARREAGEIKRILISLGGVDQGNVTGQVLEAIGYLAFEEDLELDIVMGASAPHTPKIRRQVNRLSCRATVSVNVDDMAERMSLADLSIGGVGSTSWERCSLGLPSLLFVLAENQAAAAQALVEARAAIVVDSICQMLCELKRLIQIEGGSGSLREMAKASSELVKGEGCGEILKKITQVSYEL